MIIEIKNLPEGRNVTKISFDIEFEDGVPTTITKSESFQVGPEPVEPNEEIPEPVITGERPEKDIPDEMKDAEF